MSGRSFSQALAWIAGGVATLAALAVAIILALIAGMAAVVIGVMATALLTLAAAARKARAASARRADPTVIEARNIGGHSWVAYGWDSERR
jgi:flagellar biosynthesis component FlhA